MTTDNKEALERLAGLGYSIAALEKALEQLGKVFAAQKTVIGDLSLVQAKEHGAYRQFEKRDKRKNFRR